MLVSSGRLDTLCSGNNDLSIGHAKQKKRGRPFADTERLALQVQRTLIRRIDEWRKRQSDKPNRPEAMRRLITRGLDSEE